MNTGFIGDKGQGKSYMLARTLSGVLVQNKVWHEKNKLPIRKVAVMETLGLSEKFKSIWSEYLVYFKNIDELPQFKEMDVFVDDISMRLDSRNWDLLTQGCREWLYGSERLGCDLYFTAQKFSRVEITFRLLTDAIFICTKGMGSKRPSATKPEVKRIWGWIWVAQISKSDFQAEHFNQDDFGGGRPVLLRKKFINMYDHTKISLTDGYPPLTAIVRHCYDPDCPEAMANNGHHIKVKHV